MRSKSETSSQRHLPGQGIAIGLRAARILRRCLLLVPCLLAAGLLLGAHALGATLRSIQLGTWTISARSDDQTKQFDNCTAQAGYSNAIAISFSVDRQFLWHFAMSSMEWDFSPGSSFDVILKIGALDTVKEHATASNGQILQVVLDDPTAVFDLLRRGKSLQVFAGARTYEFALADAPEVFSTLLQCLTQQLTSPARTARTAGKQPNSAAVPRIKPTTTALAHAETNAFANDLLSEARISRFQLLEPETGARAGVPGNSTWKAGDITGSVSIMEGSASINDLVSQLMANDAQACQGFFFAGSLPITTQDASRARLLSSCQLLSTTTFTYYFSVPRSAGGFYVLASTGSMATAKVTGSAGDDSKIETTLQTLVELDSNLRLAIPRTLSK
jgi:hypothetical protein